MSASKRKRSLYRRVQRGTVLVTLNLPEPYATVFRQQRSPGEFLSRAIKHYERQKRALGQ